MAFLASKCTRNRFWLWLRPGPHWGSLWRSPRPPSWMGRGHPLLHPSPQSRRSWSWHL